MTFFSRIQNLFLLMSQKIYDTVFFRRVQFFFRRVQFLILSKNVQNF